MRLLTLSIAISLAAATSAQPTLTQATNGFTIGQSYALNYSPYALPGLTGPDQVWDFSALAVDSSTFIQWVDPATTTSGALFPVASIAEEWNVVSFSDQDATGLYVHGSDEQGTVVALSDTRRALAWPFTYTNTWTDDYAGTYSVAGFDVTRTGTYNGEADAYGTLQMPWGSVEDALRIHITAAQSDESLFATITQDIDSYQWFVAGEPWPVLEVVSTTITSPLGPIETSYTLWMNDAVTGIGAPRPSPVTLTARLLPSGTGYAFSRAVSGVLLDDAGRTVRTLGRAMVLELDGLAPGLYLLRADDGATVRLVR
ncbi:MAG: hypothetical protein IPK70_06535 [Flavobacteriales bacterium]|jgi:hypothetical protein|nr:hypothetical protein [Flavobacteriales bacterium]